MALSFANTTVIYRGPWTLLTTEATLDTSYLTGGETIAPADVGLREFFMIIPGSSEGFNVEAIRSSPTAGLIQVFSNSASTNTAIEFASALDRSDLTVDLLIIGR